MKTNLIIIAIAALTLLFSCDKEEESPVIPKTELLAGTTQRSWYIHSTTPEEDGSCSSGADDSWIFFPDGSFEYDHGTITEDATNGCSDFVNFIGTWELTDNETIIKVVAEHKKDDPSTTFSLTVMEGKLNMLSNENFVVVATDPSTSSELTVEFRRR